LGKRGKCKSKENRGQKRIFLGDYRAFSPIFDSSDSEDPFICIYRPFLSQTYPVEIDEITPCPKPVVGDFVVVQETILRWIKKTRLV
jgi:hypothetical protein